MTNSDYKLIAKIIGRGVKYAGADYDVLAHLVAMATIGLEHEEGQQFTDVMDWFSEIALREYVQGKVVELSDDDKVEFDTMIDQMRAVDVVAEASRYLDAEQD